MTARTIPLSVLSLLLAWGARAELAPFNGTFAYAGGTNEQAVRVQAIDRTVAGMSVFLRPIARPRLNAVTKPYPVIALTIKDERLTFARPASAQVPETTATLDGTAAPWTGDDGKPYQASFTEAPEGVLKQVIRASDGGREQTYTLSTDGQTLTVHVTITSGKFDGPLTYTLTYARRKA